MLAATQFADPWRFQPNPEVYVLVAFLVGAYVYMVRTIGPRAVAEGEPPIRRRHVVSFVAAMVVLFVASTWPIHQIGEDYLYSVHMIQHMLLSYVLPPLVLLATPEWLLRAVLGQGRGMRAARFLCRPVVAGVLYNAVVFIMHIPGVVNTATTVGPLHFSLHLLIVLAAIIMQVGGGYYLWSIIIFTFFRRFSTTGAKENSYRRSDQIPTAEITGNDEFPLTFTEVEGAFGRSEAPAEPSADRRLQR